MNVQPIPFSEAKGNVRDDYQRIIDAFGIGYLPMFFQYIGPFPAYLDYITDQIVSSLGNNRFASVTAEVADALTSLMAGQFSKPDEVTSWLLRYRYSPQYYYFQEDMKRIYRANMKLVFLFVALREAVKGWAIAAKKLEPSIPTITIREEKQFVYEDTAEALLPIVISHTPSAQPAQSSSLQHNAAQQMEINLLIGYMRLCRAEFDNLMREEKYLIFRVETEKMILRTLPLLPGLIFSPINVVLEKASRYKNYGELLYLLSELFPQLAVQKMLFSAYML